MYDESEAATTKEVNVSAVELLGREIDRLGSALDHLAKRLDPILTPSVPTDDARMLSQVETTPESSELTRLVGKFSDQTGRLERLTARVEA